MNENKCNVVGVDPKTGEFLLLDPVYGYDGDPVETWLDKCAWKAMQGLLACPTLTRTEGFANESHDVCLARASYVIAKAMLAEKLRIEKGETQNVNTTSNDNDQQK